MYPHKFNQLKEKGNDLKITLLKPTKEKTSISSWREYKFDDQRCPMRKFINKFLLVINSKKVPCSESNDLSPERAVTNLSLGTYSSIEAETIKS